MAFEKVRDAMLATDSELVVKEINAELAKGADPKAIFDVLTDAMGEIGDLFSEMKMFLPEVMLATEAMNEAFAILGAEMQKQDQAIENLGTVVIGTVKGDVHTVGKDMVTGTLNTAGFKVFDIGIDSSPQDFVEIAEREGADIIGLSALMTATMPSQKDVIEFLESNGIREKSKVLVGGGVVTQEWADEIGADGYSKDAVGAVDVAKRLVGR